MRSEICFGVRVALGVSTLLIGARDASAQDSAAWLLPLSEPHFAHYESPGECAWAGPWIEDLFWRARRRDTIAQARTGHAYQLQTQGTIAGCASRFRRPDVAARDLIGLAQAELVSGHMVQADTALARLTNGAPAAGQAWAYCQAVDVYLTAPEPQLKGAAKYLAQLDAMGATAAVERMLAHTEMAREAERRDSVPLWDRETQAALVASQAITGDTQKEYAFESAAVYMAVAQLKARQNDVAGAEATLVAGRTELVPLRPGVAYLFDAAEPWYAVQGKKPGPVPATRWAIGGTPGDTQPVAGKPAVVLLASPNCGDACYPMYAILHRLIGFFPPSRLDVILVTHTEGWGRGRLMPPDSEVVSTRDYFLNDLQLPVNIAMWHADVTRRADQRLMMLPTPFEQAYHPPNGAIGVLDRNGVLRMYVKLDRQHELLLQDLVASLIQ